MELTQLEVFLSLAETNSFSETARRLHRSQSSITRKIKQLEVELSTRLFYRSTHTVRLTESGKTLVSYAEKMIGLSENMKRSISLMEKTIAGPMKIGASFSISEEILPELLGQYQALYPQVQLHVTIGSSQEIIQALENRELDFGITEAPNESKMVVSHPFMEDELVVFAPNDHDLASKETLTFHDLVDYPLIMREKGSGMRALLEKEFAAHNISIEDLNIVMELNNTETIKKMVLNDLGVAILSRQCIKREVGLQLLQPQSLSPEALTRYFYYSYRKGEPLYPSIEAMEELLKEMYV